MSLDEARSLITELWRAWSAPDLDALGRALGADCEWKSGPILGLSERTLRGREAVLAFVEEVHRHGTVELRLLEAVEGPHGIATISQAQSTNRERGTSGIAPSFDRFLLVDGQVSVHEPYRARSALLSRVGIERAGRPDALIVRGWDDPRVYAHGPEDRLVGRRMRYQRYLGDDHVHCELSWRKIWNVENDGDHRAGYVALDPTTDEPTSAWVSEESFDECRELFGWQVVPTPPEVV